MYRSLQLAKRIKEVILNGTWIANTNYKDQLTNVSWEMAIRSINNLNSIAVLSQHIHYYITGISKVLNGGALDISDQYSFDFAPINSKEDWDRFLFLFWRDTEVFATLIEQVAEEQWDKVFVKEQYGTYQRNVEGMIEHSYYHLGQIVLIKKLLVT